MNIARLNLSQDSLNSDHSNFTQGRLSLSSAPMSNPEKYNIAGTRFTTDGVNQPEYVVNIPPSEARVKSPTLSDMGIFTITIDEEIESYPLKGIAKELFYSPKYSYHRKWFSLKRIRTTYPGYRLCQYAIIYNSKTFYRDYIFTI